MYVYPQFIMCTGMLHATYCIFSFCHYRNRHTLHRCMCVCVWHSNCAVNHSLPLVWIKTPFNLSRQPPSSVPAVWEFSKWNLPMHFTPLQLHAFCSSDLKCRWDFVYHVKITVLWSCKQFALLLLLLLCERCTSRGVRVVTVCALRMNELRER